MSLFSFGRNRTDGTGTSSPGNRPVSSTFREEREQTTAEIRRTLEDLKSQMLRYPVPGQLTQAAESLRINSRNLGTNLDSLQVMIADAVQEAVGKAHLGRDLHAVNYLDAAKGVMKALKLEEAVGKTVHGDFVKDARDELAGHCSRFISSPHGQGFLQLSNQYSKACLNWACANAHAICDDIAPTDPTLQKHKAAELLQSIMERKPNFRY